MASLFVCFFFLANYTYQVNTEERRKHNYLKYNL